MPDTGRLSLEISEQIGERHPDILVGGMLVTGLLAAAVVVADQPFPTDTAKALLNQDVTIELVADHPLVRDWRTAIAGCGLKPSTYKSSPEQLARRTLKIGPVRSSLPLVDLYCEVATRHLAPLGGYDVGRLPSGELQLRLADAASDTFNPLGGRNGDMAPSDRVVVYADGSTVLCWAYNCRDSRDTCLTAETDVGLFLGEAVTARQHEALRTALADLAERLHAAGAIVGPVTYASWATSAVEFLPAS